MSIDASGQIIIREAENESSWDEYLKQHPQAVFYQLYGWGRALEEAFGFRRFYLQAQNEGRVCGVLPLVLTKTIFGKQMISLPIGVYAGALTDNPQISQMLIDRAKELVHSLNCDYLELRNKDNLHPGLPSKELYVTFIRELPGSPEECLDMLPRKARAACRQAQDAGLSYDTGLKYLDICYDIYALNQRYLGTPVVGKKWFMKLVEIFQDKTEVMVIKLNQQCISAVLAFFYKDTALPFYGGCIPKFFSLNPNNYMYLRLQEYAVKEGYRYFDFGRSRKDSGSYQFKINQGFQPQALHYQYYLYRAKKIPDISPSDKAFDLARWAWRHFPLGVTRLLGPKLFKLFIQ